jgi:hypothetical protein
MKSERKDLKLKYGQITIPTFKSKSGREFRLSSIFRDDIFKVTIFWLDTNLFETFAYDKIEPYLKSL